MSNKTPVRFGLIGAGAIAQTYVQSASATPAIQIVGVADPRLEAAQAAGGKLNCPAFASHEELFEKTGCEAVIICAPPVSHAPICEYFLARNVHVLCEKPLAPSPTDCRKIVSAARTSSALLTMASKFRFVEDVCKARELIAEGLIGDVILFENAFTARVDMSKRWNSNPALSGGGVLIDNGTHSVDIMRYFLGPLAEIQVIEGLRVQPIEVEDTVKVYVRSKSGIMGSIDLSWSINKELPDYIRIYGSQGTLSVGWKESKYRRSTDSDWVVFGRGYDKVQAFSSQLTNFAGAIRDGEPLNITLSDAVASVEVIHAAYQAMRGQTWLPISRDIQSAA